MVVDADGVAALESNIASIFADFGRGPGGRVVETPTRVVLETPVTRPPYNGVYRFHDEGTTSVGHQVEELVSAFARREVTGVWLLHPTTPPTVADALEACGWAWVEDVHGMVGSFDDLPEVPLAPDGVSVVEAGAEASHLWFHLASWRYGLDVSASPYLQEVYRTSLVRRSRLWVAHLDGEPVSKAGMHLRDGVAGIYGVVTTEQGRGLGLATLLTLTALHAARGAGARTAVLHSTPMARSLYRRLGFRDVAPFGIWAAPGTFHV